MTQGLLANRTQIVDNDNELVGGSASTPQIVQVVDETEKVSPAGELVSNAPYSNATIQNPVWAHVLDEQPFNAQAADGSATAVDVLGYSDLAFTITDAVCDGVITVTDGLGAPLSFLLDNNIVTSFTGAGAGTNYHHCQIINAKPKQVIFVLASRTTGSVSVDFYGL